MAQARVDLVNVFQSVTQALVENQQALDRSDDYNQDHGSNMVQTFQTITSALEKKKGSSDSAALAYAAKALSRSATSGSSRLYAQNLSQAATQFKGKRVDEQGALQLLQMLIGSQPTAGTSASAQPAASGGDLLGTLLGGLAGDAPQAQQQPSGGDLLGTLLGGLAGDASQAQQQPSSPGGDLLGTLLGGLAGGESAGEQQQGGITLQNLLAGGLAFLQAKQSGKDTLQALVQAFVAGSNMGSSPYRNQSTQVVVQSFLQALMAARQ